MNPMNPRVVAVTLNPDFTLKITFTNNEVKVFDVNPYLTIGVFKELADPAVFGTVRPCLGSIAWPNGQDFCPDTLYLDSREINS